MPFTVRIKNFQSIKDLSLRVDGFTAIQGVNDTGKSAVLRAISFLCRNQRGDYFVRHGADYCEVQLEFPDATVTWQKGKGKNHYRINDDPWLENVSYGVPEDVQKVLRVQGIDAGSHSLWPQVASQAQPIFLLDHSGPVIAEAVSDVHIVGRLNKALKMTTSDKRRSQSVLRIREQDLSDLADKVKSFEGLHDVEALLQHVSELELEANRLQDQINRLESWSSELAGLQRRIDHLSGVSDVPIPTVEEAREALDMGSRCRELQRLSSEYLRTSQFAVKYRGQRDSIDLDTLDTVIKKASKARDLINRLSGWSQGLGRWSEEYSHQQQLHSDLEDQIVAVRGDMLKGHDECPLCGSESFT